MAKTVNEEKTIELLNGETIQIRPLKVSLLRSFMKKFEEIQDTTTDNDKSITVLMECVQIAMKQYKPELAEDMEALEEMLDLPSVYRIVEEASGVRLADSLIQ
jgi:inhibitor of KinA sporulation pathway (predicted exonuclease)